MSGRCLISSEIKRGKCRKRPSLGDRVVPVFSIQINRISTNESDPVNQRVAGSSPAGGAKFAIWINPDFPAVDAGVDRMLVDGRGVQSARSRQRVIALAQIIEFSEPALPRLLGPALSPARPISALGRDESPKTPPLLRQPRSRNPQILPPTQLIRPPHR